MKLYPDRLSFIYVCAVAAAVFMAGCGGGGGQSTNQQGPTVPAVASAEGFYGGTLTGSSSSTFEMVVLENGEVWGLYGNESASLFTINGFIQGTTTTSGLSLSSLDGKDFGLSPALPATMSAQFNTATKTITGTVTSNSGSVSFNGGPIAGSLYKYDTPAANSTIVGSWSLNGLMGDVVALTVASNGDFTATSDSGCQISGKITPRPSGKNIFNVAISFGAAPCGLQNQSAAGIAVAYPLANGRTQLIVAAHDNARTSGDVLVGVR